MIRNHLRDVTQATLRRLGFNHGFLLIATDQDGRYHAEVSVGYALEQVDESVWQQHLRRLPLEQTRLLAIEWLPENLAPGYAIPLQVDGQCIGLLIGTQADSTQLPAWVDAELVTACEKLSLAAYNSYLKRQSERRLRQLQLISQVNQRITPLITSERKLETVVQIVRDTFDFYHASIFLVDPWTQQLEIRVVAGAGEGELTAMDLAFLQEGKGLTSWVARTGEPVLVNDVTQEQRYQQISLLPNTRAEVVVPIKVADKTIGVLDVQSDRRNAFDFVDLLALQIVANQVAHALENHRLLQQERARREMVQTLQETGRVISSSLQLERLLDLILQELGHVVSYDNVRLKRVKDDVARVIAARGFDDLEQVMGTTYRVSENTLASLIVYERQTVNIADITKDPRWLWLPGTQAIRSWIGVPLVMKDEVIGLLSVSRVKYKPFTQDELEVVSSFASQAAIAIENARLYNELKEFSATLEERVRERTKELEEAREELAAVLSREVEVQETERIRIANELHDSVIQAMIAVNFQLQSIKLNLGDERSQAIAQLTGVQQMLDKLVAEIKAVVHDLRPPTLESLGLVHAIRQLAAQYDDPPQFAVQLQVLGSVRSLSSSAERTVYRVTQEALSNARRHSGASQFRLALIFEPAGLKVVLQDNGCGFDPEEEAGKGLGLLTMSDRARSSGGTLSIHSAPNEGTRIELQLPVRTSDMADHLSPYRE